MDAYLAVASKRDERRYASERPVPDEVTERILDAGRLSGSSKNSQPWTFVVVASPDARDRLAEAVYNPRNVCGAALVVAVLGKRNFDTGRAAQNMMLAAWDEGVVSCPNGIADADAAAALLGGEAAIVLTFGYPARVREPYSRRAEDWSARANRRPLDEVVRRL
jgi:nitroreductase